MPLGETWTLTCDKCWAQYTHGKTELHAVAVARMKGWIVDVIDRSPLGPDHIATCHACRPDRNPGGRP